MEQEFENGIMYRMMPHLTNEQAMVLKQTLEAINKESNLTMTNDHIIEPFDVLMGDDMFPLTDKSNDKFPLTYDINAIVPRHVEAIVKLERRQK